MTEKQAKDSKSPAALPQSILIVEDDPAAKAAAIKLASDMGIQHVESAETSEAGWAALRLHRFDLVMLDWKLLPASGAALLHRIRANPKTQDIPVLVVSGAISKKEFIFAEEYLFTAYLEKPYEVAQVIRKIKELIKDKQWFDQTSSDLEKMISSADDFHASSIDGLVKLVQESPRPGPIGYAAARALISRNQVESARILLEAVLAKDGNAALSLTLMGKAYLLQRNFVEAKKYLLQAHKMFPKNSERLVLMGDTDMNLLDFEAAKDSFQAAAAIDPKNAKAVAGAALAESTEKYFSQVGLAKAPASLPSLLNTIGVGLVHGEKYDEGFQYYQNALTYLEDATIKGRVSFNLGLGYLRAHRKDDALTWFQKSDELSGGHFQKPRDYIMKLTNGAALLVSPTGPAQDHHDEHDLFSLDSPDSGSPVSPPSKQPKWAPMGEKDESIAADEGNPAAELASNQPQKKSA